jgi:hypothetical protein
MQREVAINGPCPSGGQVTHGCLLHGSKRNTAAVGGRLLGLFKVISLCAAEAGARMQQRSGSIIIV